ncbi:MAG: DoxX family protein [Comamonadaceae bacterium PBBC2]|nr:MAG: DoxX family protein [Comamonadaceae bacterium PBBC2]
MSQVTQQGLNVLDQMGLWIGLLSLRLILAWEFGEAGFEKLHGSNWFADIQNQFPWPFKLIPADLNWALATGFEVVGAIALVIGLGTRFFSASLIVLTVVAMLSVHWPESWSTLGELLQGYALTDKGHGNFKLPVIYIAMLLPLVFMGPGRLSLDALIRSASSKNGMHR